jgi:uncharacterized protein YndB with AHSA1/START domain
MAPTVPAQNGRVSRTFRFHHVWKLEAPPERVFGVLADVDRYAVWWPQVRTVQRIDEESGRTRIRSVLPYTLDLVLRREIEDAEAGRLRVGVTGDLEGWCQWTLEDGLGVTCASFDQVAVVTPRLLSRTADVAAPLLRLNHAWMMHGGQAGLRAFLARA